MSTSKLKHSKAVIGLGFGDEGKGLVVGHLSYKFQRSADSVFNRKKTLNVRYSTGPQAAHRVVTANGTEKVFSVFGSGSFYGADTYLSEYVAINLELLKKHIKELMTMGFVPKLMINPKCPIITPYDMYFNQNDPNSLNHGTCGAGVWATFLREQNKMSLLYEDIFNKTTFDIKLKLIKEYYEHKLNKILNISSKIEVSKRFLMNNKNVTMTKFPSNYDNIIFESSQGLLLDRFNGFFPHVTSSSVGTMNIMNILRKKDEDELSFNNIEFPELYLVTRAYQTKHGNGPMTNQHLPLDIKLHDGEKNIHNEFQGEFKTSVLDLDLLKYAIRKDEHINRTDFTLIITCLDHIIGKYKYTLNGKLFEFSDRFKFIKSIQKELNVSDVWFSSDEYSEDLFIIN